MNEQNFDIDNAPLLAKFGSVESKYRSLADQYKLLQRKLRDIENEKKKLEISLEKQKNENKEIKNRVIISDDFHNSKKIVKIVSNKLKQAEQTTEWKGVIEELIGEIDRCIELLEAY